MQSNDTRAAVLRTPNGSLAIERACNVCGAPFLAPTARLAKGMALYCSRPCSFVGRSKKVARACLTCGTLVTTKLSEDARYCSPACYHESQRGERVPLTDRFWAKVKKTDTCWPWTGATVSGYGNLGIDNRSELAHRVAWTLATGDALTDDDKILHICDVRPCVRNDDEGTYDVEGVTYRRVGHLVKATIAANNLDARQKGRNRLPSRQPTEKEHPRGDDHWSARRPERVLRGAQKPNARPSIAEALDLHVRYAAGGVTLAKLARKYGVSHAQASLISRGLTWHFSDPHDV